MSHKHHSSLHIQAFPDPSFQGNPRDSAALLLASPTQSSQKEGSRVKRAEEEGGKALAHIRDVVAGLERMALSSLLVQGHLVTALHKQDGDSG